jgi:hypothetical protein
MHRHVLSLCLTDTARRGDILELVDRRAHCNVCPAHIDRF